LLICKAFYFLLSFIYQKPEKHFMIRYTTESATIYQPQITKERTEKQKANEVNLQFHLPKEADPVTLYEWIEKYSHRLALLDDKQPPELATSAELYTWIKERKKSNYNGTVSAKTAREVTRRISNLLELTPKAGRLVTFTTLTLPTVQKHSDNWIKRYMLNEFLEYIQKKHKVINYIWKAEAQQNGNIHFHIMADSYLPNAAKVSVKRQGRINEAWNMICTKYGYLEGYKEARIAEARAGKMSKSARKWNKAFNYSVPNSTDVHKLSDKAKPESYICKYVAKNESDEVWNKEQQCFIQVPRRAIEGRLIGCSDALKEIDNFQENENATSSGWSSYCALQQMAQHHRNNKQVKEIHIDSDNVRYVDRTPPEGKYIVISKFYFPPDIWKAYAPHSHKQNRNKHFNEVVKNIYGRNPVINTAAFA
jgi:hypothetical protein